MAGNKWIAQWFEARWYGQPGMLYALAPLSLAYGAARAVRAWTYRRGLAASARLSIPVVVVGNISAGGSGKTPLVLWLAGRLQERGYRPGVLCRSYAASASHPAEVARDDDPLVRGDEAVLLARRLACPVWSGPDRSATARAMPRAHPQLDVLVCDDGLQHTALARDVELAVIDASRGIGNGWLLPVGPLRDPPARLASVDAIVFNGDTAAGDLSFDRPGFRMRLEGRSFQSLTESNLTATADAFVERRIAAVAGIGNPARFFEHLRSLGLVFEEHAFPDHHAYSAADLRLPGADIVLMTEKDAIKCRAIADRRMWSLPIEAKVDDALLDLVLARIGAPRGRTAATE